jgi:predicted MFS family arabinose efflux permease
LCLIAPLLFGRDFHGAPWLWLVMLLGLLVIAGFLALERHVERSGGLPLVASALIADRLFLHGLAAAFCFFSANLSFYFVLTLFLQGGLGYSPWEAGLTVLPLALAFVIASRRGMARGAARGGLGPVAGCGWQIIGLGALALVADFSAQPAMLLLALTLAVFGYGQGLVMAPLSSIVLATVRHADAGSASGVYATTVQIANAAGVAAIGALFFTARETLSDRLAFLAALAAVAAMVAAAASLLAWRRHAVRV